MKLHITVLVFIVFAMALTGCIDHEGRPLTPAQKQAVADNIKPFHFVDTGEGFVEETIEVLAGYSKYAACAACHGANGGGGVGPALVGQTADYLTGRLNAYRAGEKVGSQSNLMWAQAGGLSDQDIADLVEYVATL